MAKYLVIVESPAKVKTIKKFLGSNYDVEASNGHVWDFPKSQFGIDVEHEITKTAVKASIKQARDLDMDLVDAQQARRMLDRMVGYTISPLLWAKVKRGLSAGRVQSVALRIICDREDEINAFIPEEYWSLEGEFQVKGEKKPLQAKFYGTDKKRWMHFLPLLRIKNMRSQK